MLTDSRKVRLLRVCPLFSQKYANLLIITLTLNILLTCTLGRPLDSSKLALGTASSGGDQTGQLIQDPQVSTTSEERTEDHNKSKSPNVIVGLINKHDQHQQQPRPKNDVDKPRRPSSKRRNEVLSTDCFAKRNDILSKRGKQIGSTRGQLTPNNSGPATISNYQKLKPGSTSQIGNLTGNFDSFNSEHIPQCTPSGTYEPVQCHKIGYCWCVNKFGQAIRNSAVLAGQKPHCDSSIYESEGNDLTVVTGISAGRLKNFLKPPTSGNSSNNNDSDSDSDIDLADQDGRLHSKDPSGEFSRRVSASEQPSLALVPNECSMSRANARERASKHNLYNDSIWIPDCDLENDKLYAEKQCHKSSICWCVDQITGLPSSSGDQLGKQATLNCTRTTPLPPSTFFNGFSKLCEADKRYDFVLFLINQFRNQLSEYKLLNLSSPTPDGLASLNPFRLNQAQVSKWKFATMDLDLDGKLDDREWSKFKNNFKLVSDDFDGIQRLHKQQSHTLGPLNIPRNQRGCWRDFLQFCGNGDILADDSITLAKWLSCTELPPKLNLTTQDRSKGTAAQRGSSDNATESIYEYLKAAARSKKRNPFLGILKPN